MCPIVIDSSSPIPPWLRDPPTFPPTDTFTHNTQLPVIVEQDDRGRSRSRSPRRSRTFPNFCYSPSPTLRRSSSRSRSRSRSPSPIWRRLRPRSFSPASIDIINIPPPSPIPPIPVPITRQPSPFVPPPSWYVAPSPAPGVWRTLPSIQPTDILTFNYKNTMAYAPAAKTYDEAIDIVLELWPELREFERDQIRLLVSGSGELVRVPKMSWSAVLCDIPRYEMMHVQVEERPPPPQYQDKGKGKGDNNEKGRRSGGLFSSIKRIFSGRGAGAQGGK